MVFEFGRGRYAVDLTSVVEVIPLTPITPIPATPEVILGAMNVKGQVLPVLDLGLMLKEFPLKAPGSAGQTDRCSSPRPGDEGLLLRAAGYDVAGVVGRLLDVSGVVDGPRPRRAAGPSETAPLSSPVLDRDGRPLQLVHLERILKQVAGQMEAIAARMQLSPFSATAGEP